MDIKITQEQYKVFKNGLITTSFEKLDVNGDNQISEDDLKNVENSQIMADITTILNAKENDSEVQTFSLDEINELISNAQKTGTTTNTQDSSGTTSTSAAATTTTTPDTSYLQKLKDVDTTNVATADEATLKTMLETVNANLTVLQTALKDAQDKRAALVTQQTALNTQKTNITAELTPLNQERDGYVSTRTTYETELKELQAKKAEKEEELEKESKTLKIYVNEYDTVMEEIETVNDKMRKEQELQAITYEEKMETIVNEAIKSYDPEKDGVNFESYFAKELSDKGYVLFSNTSSFDAKSSILSAQAIKVLKNISSQSSVVSGLQSVISDYASQITAKQDAINGMNTKISDVDARIADVNSRLNSVNDQLTTINTQIAAYDTEITNINTKITEQTTKKTAITNAIGVIENKKHDPLAFDINGDGVKTSKELVSFDIDGDGEPDTINNSADWVLAFDKDGNGKAGENGSELFGNNTDFDGDGKADGYKDGFEALKALAQKEGLISENDSKLDKNDLDKLSKKYGLVMTNGYGGEAKSLTELGITEINISQSGETKRTENFDGMNNDLMTQDGATFVVNGETRQYADIWNVKKNQTQSATSANIAQTSNTDNIFTNSKSSVFDKKSANTSNSSNSSGSSADLDELLNRNYSSALSFSLGKLRLTKAQKPDFKAIKEDVIDDMEIPDEISDRIVKFKEEDDKKS